MSYLFNNKVGFEDTAIDSFARLKVANPVTIFDSQHRYKDNGKWDTLLVNGGTATHDPNESTIKMTIGITAGAKVVRQSRSAFAYQPGKSLLVLNTFAMDSGRANLTQRVGYFNEYNGIFLERSGFYGTSLSVVLRSNVTGSTTENRVYQNEWNGDKFDGSGPSGRTLDTTKGNIMWTDVEWLGVGDVRCGFIVDGRPVVAHTFHHDNEKPTTYMTTAVLPIRYEIFNGNTGSTGSTMRQICSTVISEGGYSGRSVRHSVGVGLTSSAGMKTLQNSSTYYPVLSIRLSASRTDSVVVPTQLEIVTNDKVPWHYKLLLNPTLTAPSWNTHSNGTIEFDTSATGIAGGEEIRGGLFTENTVVQIDNPSSFNYQMGRSVGGTADVLTLAISCHQPNKTVSANIGWEELV